MKSLELSQLENYQGGRASSRCQRGAAIGGAAYMLSTVGLGIALAASGPVGWGVIAVAFSAKALAGASIINACT